MRATKNFKDWFYGRTEIPAKAWYCLACTMAAIYVASIITSIIINN